MFKNTRRGGTICAFVSDEEGWGFGAATRDNGAQ